MVKRKVSLYIKKHDDCDNNIENTNIIDEEYFTNEEIDCINDFFWEINYKDFII